jgi:hypothetical protein
MLLFAPARFPPRSGSVESEAFWFAFHRHISDQICDIGHTLGQFGHTASRSASVGRASSSWRLTLDFRRRHSLHACSAMGRWQLCTSALGLCVGDLVADMRACKHSVHRTSTSYSASRGCGEQSGYGYGEGPMERTPQFEGINCHKYPFYKHSSSISVNLYEFARETARSMQLGRRSNKESLIN